MVGVAVVGRWRAPQPRRLPACTGVGVGVCVWDGRCGRINQAQSAHTDTPAAETQTKCIVRSRMFVCNQDWENAATVDVAEVLGTGNVAIVKS